LTASEGLVNRMGFNNEGAGVLAARLAVSPPVNCPIGVSIGKSKVVPLEEAVDDYLYSLRAVYNFADYFAVNVSSPNTPGLRQLQDAGALATLLAALKAESERLAAGRPLRPILVKIAPDLTEPAIAELLEVCIDNGVAGVIATNTTLGRDGVKPADQAAAGQPGGMSGRPLGPISREVVRFIHRETAGKLPIIGSGGIMTADDAQAMFDAGASLVQIYSGLIYNGPSVVRQSVRRYRRATRKAAPVSQRAPRRPQPGPMGQPHPTHTPPAGAPMATMPPGAVPPGAVPPSAVSPGGVPPGVMTPGGMAPSPQSAPPAGPSPVYLPTPPGSVPSPQSATPAYQPTPPAPAMSSVPPTGSPIASPTPGFPLTDEHPASPVEPLSSPPVPPTPPHAEPPGPADGTPDGVASDPPPTTSRS
jgi:dihydroorotate dehydrogenase